LRRVKFFDSKSNQYYAFLTNNFTVDAMIVAELYKSRWKIELFFKWIKQRLRIKAFFGTSENAVKPQG
jgi:IS4 transposase